MSKRSVIFTHLIPCAICPTRSGPFSIGPVRFIFAKSFCKGAYGIPPDRMESAYRDFDELLENGAGDWIAEIKLSSPNYDPQNQLHQIKETNIAREKLAHLLVDIAIGCLQATLALPYLENAHRLTSRAAPVFTSSLQIQENGFPLNSFHVGHPGLAVKTFGNRLHVKKDSLDIMGKRLSEFSNPESVFPKINEAWCTAVYWYNQALAEPIETIRIIKLETAIEILLHAKNTTGSEGKIKDAILRVTGLSPDENIKDGKTVKQFANLIVKTRSMVLHGTSSTFYDKSNVFKDVFKDVEGLARTLLVNTCQRIEEYQASENPKDCVDEMLAQPITFLHQS